jgi:phosphopantetheine adenylyltransferase
LFYQSISSKKVIVGITGEELLRNKKHLDLIYPFEKRKDSIIQLIKEMNHESDIHTSKIIIPSGTTETDPNIDSLIISEEKYNTPLNIINEKRVLNGLNEIKILVCPLIKSKSGKLSSSDIRNNEKN